MSSGSAPPLVSICKAGQAPALLSLLAQCPRPPPALVEVAFLAAVEHGHAAVLAPLLALLTSPVPSIHRRADPAIVVAARLGHVACVQFLLDHVPVDQPTKDSQRTALMAAAEHGYVDVVKILLKAKADVNARDSEGFSPLHIASSHGDSAIVGLLLDAGASITALNEDGESALELAGNCDVARTILEARIAYPEERPESSCSASSCYAELRSGPGATLFWSAVGVGRDNLMFQQFGVYPFDRLNDTERILVLTEVCEVIAGYRSTATYDILRESARFAVFAMIKSRIKKEIEMAAHSDHPSSKSECSESQYEWRRKVTAAFESIFKCRASDVGLTIECVRRVVWNTIVNMIAKQTDRDSTFFWDKRRVFSCSNGPERPLLVAHSGWIPPDGYFSPSLPSPQQLTQQQVQITFKKLMTMTKSYLMDDEGDASGCFCQECVAEREVPLSFKLQFLDENAQSFQTLSKPGARKQLSARGRAGTFFQLRALENCSDLLDKFAKRNAKKSHSSSSAAIEHPSMTSPTSSGGHGTTGSCCPSTSTRLSCPSLRERCDELLLNGGVELRKFWCNLSTEEKWLLTEISTHELADLIAESRHHDWESLRAALHSYSLYQWEEDLLEISDDVVTISDDMSESKDLNDLIQIMLQAAVRVLTCPDVLAPAVLPPTTTLPSHARECLTAQGRPEECQRCLSDEEWDRRGRQQLESIVLCEFARKVACSYMYASEASRAQRIALELELELLHEEEQLMKLTEKKHKRRKAKSRKKKGKANAAAEPERDATPPQARTPSPDPTPESDSDTADDSEVPPLPIPVTVTVPVPAPAPAPPSPAPPAPAAAPTPAPSSAPRPSRRKPASTPTPAPVPSSTSAAAPVSTPVKPITILAPKRTSYENGMMFICTDDTYGECQSLGIFGLPRQHMSAVLECRPGGVTALFLFNISTRLLHGLFEPIGAGQDTIHPTAWSRPPGQQTPFPAQVAFKTVNEVQRSPLPEPVFRHIFPDGNRIRKLSGSQVQALLQVWDQYVDKPANTYVPAPAASLAPTPPRKPSKRTPAPKSAPRPAKATPPPPKPVVTIPSMPVEVAPLPSPVPVPQQPYIRPTTAIPILPSSSIWAPNAPASTSWSRPSSTPTVSPSPAPGVASYCPPPGFTYGEPNMDSPSRMSYSSANHAPAYTNRLNLFGDWNGIWSSSRNVPSAW